MSHHRPTAGAGIVEIDGSYGEGGGQVLRTALTLSTLLGRSTRVRRIRAGRPKPGLAPQHLTTVTALAEVCGARVGGREIGSTEVEFRPGHPPQSGSYTFDVADATQGGSAGAVCLILQTLLLPLSFGRAQSSLTLRGGTHVPWSPPFDYVACAFLPMVERMGVRATARLNAWGFYPRGGGEVQCLIEAMGAPEAAGELTRARNGEDPSARATGRASEPGVRRALASLTIDSPGRLSRVWGTALACSLPAHVAQRMADRARSVLGQAGIRTELSPIRARGVGPGAGIFLFAEYENSVAGFSALGKRGKPAETVAEEACAELVAHHESGAVVDVHLADQLLLPAALARGPSRFRTSRVTGHLLSNAHVIRQFVPAEIRVEGAEGEPGEVSVEGVGLEPG